MSQVDFASVTLGEAKRSVLEHQEDQEAFYAYMDKLRASGRAIVIDPTDPKSEVRVIAQVQERLQSRFKDGWETSNGEQQTMGDRTSEKPWTPVMTDLTGVSSRQAVILKRTFSVAPDRILSPLSECDSWLNSMLAELQGSVTVPLPIPPEKEALIKMHIRDWDTVLHALYREELDQLS